MRDHCKNKRKGNAQARANKLATAEDFRRAMRKRKKKWPPTVGELLAALEMKADHPAQFEQSPQLKRVADYGERAVRKLFADISPKLEWIDLKRRAMEKAMSGKMTDPISESDLRALRRFVNQKRPGRKADKETQSRIEIIRKRRAEGVGERQIARELYPGLPVETAYARYRQFRKYYNLNPA